MSHFHCSIVLHSSFIYLPFFYYCIITYISVSVMCMQHICICKYFFELSKTLLSLPVVTFHCHCINIDRSYFAANIYMFDRCCYLYGIFTLRRKLLNSTVQMGVQSTVFDLPFDFESLYSPTYHGIGVSIYVYFYIFLYLWM